MHAAIRVVWDRLYAISQYLPTDILVRLPLRYIGIFIQSEAISKQIILRKITLAFSSFLFLFFFFLIKRCVAMERQLHYLNCVRCSINMKTAGEEQFFSFYL